MVIMEAKLEELQHALFIPDLYSWVKKKSNSTISFTSDGSRHIVLGYTDPELDVYVYSNIPLHRNPEARQYGFLERHFVRHSVVVLRLTNGPFALASVFGTPNLNRTTFTFAYDIMRFLGDIAVVDRVPVKALKYKSSELPDDAIKDTDIMHLMENRHLVSIISPYGDGRRVIFHKGSNNGKAEFNPRLFDLVSEIISDEGLREQSFIEIPRIRRLGYLHNAEELNIIAKMVSRYFKNKPVIGGKNFLYVNGESQGVFKIYPDKSRT